MLEVKFYDTVDDSLLKFAVIISLSNGKWVFCKHKERDTYEAPGGHREVGEDIFPYLLMVKWADAQAKSDESKAEKIKTLQSIELYYKQIQEKEECISLKMLAVTGADLIKLGIKPGKEIGEILQKSILIIRI